jgi:hypothetical protein
MKNLIKIIRSLNGKEETVEVTPEIAVQILDEESEKKHYNERIKMGEELVRTYLAKVPNPSDIDYTINPTSEGLSIRFKRKSKSNLPSTSSTIIS